VRELPGLTTTTPAAGPFLFLGADGRDTLADELAAVGLPVVDGRHFQAPGRARLPFGGAVAARDALGNALERWAEARAS